MRRDLALPALDLRPVRPEDPATKQRRPEWREGEPSRERRSVVTQAAHDDHLCGGVERKLGDG
jgi:hypothetical protein